MGPGIMGTPIMGTEAGGSSPRDFFAAGRDRLRSELAELQDESLALRSVLAAWESKLRHATPGQGSPARAAPRQQT